MSRCWIWVSSRPTSSFLSFAKRKAEVRLTLRSTLTAESFTDLRLLYSSM